MTIPTMAGMIVEEKTMATKNSPHLDSTYGHIDLSTGDAAPHIVKKYELTTHFPNEHGDEVADVWKFDLRMPVTVADTLDSEDWDIVLERLQTRDGDYLSPVEAIIFSARCNGITPEQVIWKVGRTVSENLYRRFVEKRIQQGTAYSKLAWVAPSSMVKVSNPNG